MKERTLSPSPRDGRRSPTAAVAGERTKAGVATGSPSADTRFLNVIAGCDMLGGRAAGAGLLAVKAWPADGRADEVDGGGSGSATSGAGGDEKSAWSMAASSASSEGFNATAGAGATLLAGGMVPAWA